MEWQLNVGWNDNWTLGGVINQRVMLRIMNYGW